MRANSVMFSTKVLDTTGSVSASHIKRSSPNKTSSAVVDAVVMDGVTIGHPCCSVHECKIPLASKKHRFCPAHAAEGLLCQIVGCANPAEQPSFRSCADPSHRALDIAANERSKSFFQLTERLKRAKVSHPANAVATEAIPEDEAGSDLDEAECSTKPDTGNVKLRALWTRKQTHNEQLAVRPCGVIIGRETFHGSEGIGLVTVTALLSVF